MPKPTVILRSCAEYDTQRIRRIVRDGLDRLGLRPMGRTLVKPNVVAAGEIFPHAFTRPEFTEGVLLALKDRANGITELAIGERCGITVPTRYSFKEAGYYAIAKRTGAKIYHFEEEPQVAIPLYHEGRIRDCLYTPASVAAADFFVNVPKFKAHPWTTVTFSMKNYIGIQDDRHRLLDHDHKLNRKVADLQYIAQPKFIAIDAIVAGEGRMLTPLPFELGLIAMGNNQVAFDTVCCHIVGIDPLTVDHIRLAHERGFGPIALADIELAGDVPLEAARERAQGFKTGLIRVDDYFRNTSIHAYGGRPPSDTDDYCWGGCPGAIEEAIEILRVFDKACDSKMPPLHIVFGKYDGPINATGDEKVVFMGDCAEFAGTIAGRHVNIESLYTDRSAMDPTEAKHDDIFVKMHKVGSVLRKHRRDNVLRIAGCPVSVAEQTLLLVKLGGLNNPYFDHRTAPPYVSSYLSWRSRTLLQRLMGQPYNQTGPAVRGTSRPAQNLPPAGAGTRLES